MKVPVVTEVVCELIRVFINRGVPFKVMQKYYIVLLIAGLGIGLLRETGVMTENDVLIAIAFMILCFVVEIADNIRKTLKLLQEERHSRVNSWKQPLWKKLRGLQRQSAYPSYRYAVPPYPLYKGLLYCYECLIFLFF